MKAIVYEKYGPPDVLHLANIDTPVPGDNDVIVKVHATGVTAGDINGRGFTFVPTGFKFLARLMFGITGPRKPILGGDFAGEIAAVGKNVSNFSVGQPVFGIDGDGLGSYAEYRRIAADGALCSMPRNATFTEAASVLFGFSTALYFLNEKTSLKRGDHVLVIGAAGNVGMAAIQLAAHYGAHVTGFCRPSKGDAVLSFGANRVIHELGNQHATRDDAYDVIVETTGHISYPTYAPLLSPGGRVLAIAGGLKEFALSAWPYLRNGKKVITGGGMACESKTAVAQIKHLLEEGAIRPVVDRTWPLEDMVQAHTYAESSQKVGSLVVEITEAASSLPTRHPPRE